MAPEWDAELLVTRDLARALIEGSFPGLAPASVQLMGAGWDNTAYLVNDSIVFRFPRRQVAVSLLETEINLLPWLGRQLPLVIPEPAYVGAPSNVYPWPYMGYRFVAGRTIAAARVSENERRSMADPLARFLRTLHQVPANAAQAHGAGPDVLERLNIGRRRTATDERLDGLLRMGVLDKRQAIDTALDGAPSITSPRADTLVHGDLHAGQLLVNEKCELAGVVDWGDVHIGDPAVDLAGVQAILPRNAHDEFLRAYGPVDPVAWDVARARAVVHTIALLAHAAAVGNVDMVTDAKWSLSQLTAA